MKIFGKKKKKDDTPLRDITFRRLTYEAIPELWTFQILAGLLLAVPAAFLVQMIMVVAGAGNVAITTANIRSFILSWRFPVILGLAILLVFVYLVLELFTQIYLSDDILGGRKGSLRHCVASGFKSIKRFMNPSGIGIIIFILAAVPICGAGFSLTITKQMHIPNFIMDAITKNPLYLVGYSALVIFLLWTAFWSIFSLHGVLLDGLTPSEAKKQSSRIIKENAAAFIRGMIFTGLVILAINAITTLLFHYIPPMIIGSAAKEMPKGYRIDLARLMSREWLRSPAELELVAYRVAAIFSVLVEKYLIYVVAVLSGAYFMLRLTRYYLEFTGRGRELWPERPKKARYRWKVVFLISVFVLFAIGSLFLGIFYNIIFTRDEPVRIVAHRAGGFMASENSIEGLEKAIEHGCYACEIDTQRTKDGFYIINHDNDFKRLTGVARAPKDMTMDEIAKLRIKDTTGNGQELPVVTLEEMLDVIKGKVKLYVELKGATADKQMVDDVVKMIREKDCVEDTALISMKYDVIDYAESKYPEFETGTLFFAGIGDVSKLNCDLLIMEEEAATDNNINMIHKAEKQAVVWTVNTHQGMYHFLDSMIDAVITDEVELAEEVQAELDDRTDLEVLEDKLTVVQGL